VRPRPIPRSPYPPTIQRPDGLLLYQVKNGWHATEADAGRAAFGPTQDQAVAAWHRSQAAARAALERYWVLYGAPAEGAPR
jgi:hypothetical protein